MILHTIVSPEFLLRSFEEAQQQGPESEYLPVSHGFLEVRNENGRQVTSRVLSTDLSCYLSRDYAPGTEWKPK